MFGGETGLRSTAGVHQGHIKTIEYLQQEKEKSGLEYVVIREGIYTESWWLYAGYQPQGGFKTAEGDSSEIDIVIPDDGPVAWVSWDDLGLGTAKILASYEEYLGQVNVRLTGAYTTTLAETAKLVEIETGRKVNVKIVGKEESIRYHEAKKSMPEDKFWIIHNWAGWYGALRSGEVAVIDPLLERLIGRKPKGILEMAQEMFVGQGGYLAGVCWCRWSLYIHLMNLQRLDSLYCTSDIFYLYPRKAYISLAPSRFGPLLRVPNFT